ncbi:response regulator transcription factor [Streptomyces sp. NPDC057011]|uniref:response regulator transcription factor n=1 Tax=unclassified Streptomyces TaxID=2593676 RepID=UPI0036458144
MRLLLIENDPRFAELLRHGLAEEGFTTECVSDGYTGLCRALGGGYDAIVLDTLLPGMHGYELCARLRAVGRTTPVMMLATNSGERATAEGLAIGADDCLVMPFSFTELAARLKALVRIDRRRRPAVWQVGDLIIDPVPMRVWRGETEIELAAKEFAVLACLAERAGTAVSKAESINRVWSLKPDHPSNVVEVYISALRRKIDTPFGCRTIVTVRGSGYLLTAPRRPGSGR